ncbi:MAG: DUF2298 domain-containing protein, partial [Anaerolineae bacterium]
MDDGTPRQIQVGLPNNWPYRGEDEGDTNPLIQHTLLRAGETSTSVFTPEFDGELTTIRLNNVTTPTGAPRTQTLTVTVAADLTGTDVLATGTVTGDFAAPDGQPRGEPYSITLDEPLDLVEGREYFLLVENDRAGSVVLAGSTIAVEGTWDDPVPVNVPGYAIRTRQYHEIAFEMALEDTPAKRERLQYVLDNADYITISSNRFYDSLARNPQRWPMTLAYYDALFSGQLGLELVSDFTSRHNIGPIEFYDDEADEAWTVYDHPRVFVFRKTAAYDPAVTAAVLNQANLDEVVRATAKDAPGLPDRVQRPEEYGIPLRIEGSAAPGDVERGLFARVQVLAVPVWWVTIAAVGLAAFPLTYVAFPGLPDRGYGLSRIVGLLLAAWIGWLVATTGLLRWGAPLVWLSVLAVAALSAGLAWSRRDAIARWIRDNRQTVLTVEVLFAILFLLFLVIRMANPDLWHPVKGGEKPMNMAYFNAVLNTQTFPAYDPWFAGGTINYYYFGYVIAAVPTKLLGMMPELAYNLLVPTFFALTGVGVFTAARALMPANPEPDPLPDDLPAWRGLFAAWPDIGPSDALAALDGWWQRVQHWLLSRPGIFAGLLAVALALLLGNLGQLRFVSWQFAELGAGPGQPEMEQFLPPAQDTAAGVARLLGESERLPVYISDWYWNATRMASALPITEFPYFTFLYGDLHAHMIAFPLTLLVVAAGVAFVKAPAAHWSKGIGAVLLGALAAGMLVATNTWDAPTYILLGAGLVALGTAFRRDDRTALPGKLIGGALAAAVGVGVYYRLISAATGETGTLDLAIAGLAGLAVFLIAYAITALVRGEGTPWRTLIAAGLWAGLWGAVAVLVALPYLLNYTADY